MVSGKYSALSGAVAREQTIGNIAANLANVSTAGFKKDRISFAAMLKGAEQANTAQGINHARIRAIKADFSQGGMETTGRSLDVAIDGSGFFKVQNGNETFYTRAGHLLLDENGFIRTGDGFTVLGAGDAPLQIDATQGHEVYIGESGDISVNGVLSGAKLQVFAVENQEQLRKLGNSLYKLEKGADQPMERYRVVRGALESSNVNMMEEMTAMIATQRTFEAHTKVLESYSKLGERQDELGSVG